MTLVLCSRNDTVRTKWSSALQSKYRIQQATSVDKLYSILSSIPVDVILMHRSMVDEKQLQELCAKGAGSRVFVFADRPDNLEGAACLRMGCVGYTNTYIAPVRLLAAVQTVESGLVWVGTSLMQHLIKSLATEKEESAEPKEVLPAIASLSEREYQIAHLVASGLHNSEIGEELGITERTVKAHLGAVYIKTQTKGRLNLALLMNKG